MNGSLPAHAPSRRSQQHGFSLVEILVGLGIGMLGMVIMLQVFGLSEGYKRTTTTGDDAQTSGAIALYTVQRDLRQSGHGVNNDYVLGCSLQLRAGVNVVAAPVVINPATTIVPAGDAGTDTLLILIGNGMSSPEGDRLTNHTPVNTYQVSTGVMFGPGDYVVAARASSARPCSVSMEQVTAVNGANVLVPAGDATVTATGWLMNLGRSPRVQAYAVRNKRLTVCDYMVNNCATASTSDSSIWVPIADNIVSMRAQYARSSAPTETLRVVDTYDLQTPASNANVLTWKALLGVRMVLVARSAQFEKTEVTANAPTWAGSGTEASAINLSTGDANWKQYRYKTFEAVVPLFNQSSI